MLHFLPVNQERSLNTLILAFQSLLYEIEINKCLHLPYLNLQLIATLFCSSTITGTPLTKGICVRNPEGFYLPPDYDVLLCGMYS